MGLLGRIMGNSSASFADRLIRETGKKFRWAEIPLKETEAGREFLDLPKEEQAHVARALIADAAKSKAFAPGGMSGKHRVVCSVIGTVMQRNLPLSDNDLCFLFAWISRSDYLYFLPIARAVAALQHYSESETPSEKLVGLAAKVRTKLESGDADARRLASKIMDAVGLKSELPLVSGEVWSDRAIEWFDAADHSVVGAWNAIFAHCRGASAGKPTRKWLKEAETLLSGEVSKNNLRDRVVEWFPLAEKPAIVERTMQSYGHRYNPDPLEMAEVNQDILKGLAWYCRLVDDPDIVRALSSLAISAFRKIAGKGPRAVRLGNACIHVLGQAKGVEALSQLALVKVKVKNRATQNQIEKALAAAAARGGVTVEELEEMSVPEYGLTGIGILEETMGDFTARLSVIGTGKTELVFVKPDGNLQKSIPAAVKEKFSTEIKELRAAAKDIQKILPAVRERIDSLFLRRQSWSFCDWNARYHNHPLVGFLARRLIWRFGLEGDSVDAIWWQGKFVDADGKEVLLKHDDDLPVAIWHPLDCDTDSVIRWRIFFEKNEIQQPFKQVHREVYILTEAEERTATYSNRYAAHVLKQHQFNALCQSRYWRNKLRLMVDDEYPPATRLLPEWDLRSEFWIEGAGDDWGNDTNESGTYLYLITDQVRFYPIDAAQFSAHASGGGYGPGWQGGTDTPLPLSEVPPRVFSEIMRDIDLFVGVASVGNDQNWSDGGPGGRFRDYWTGYSFGDLSATAQTRKEVLVRLLPRLKIASVTKIDGKFLVVEGKIRTYKIHLGSGNILMSPNDQYLCIVPNASQRRGTDKIFLPFEGDNTMAVILSKAFLLAADDKIKDRTILSQIGN